MKQRIIFSVTGVALVLILFYFGGAGPKKKPVIHNAESTQVAVLDPRVVIDSLKKTLNDSQLRSLQRLEDHISHADNPADSASGYNAIAGFWKDSAASLIPYAFYLNKSALLDNSEKSLTFAARFIFENMRRESQPELKLWEAQTAAGLFEQALKLNPSNTDLKIGLGSCYVYGPGMTGDAQQAMTGIQQLLEVVRQDSNNMKAQMVLGIASVISGQTGKGIERLKKVADFDPQNLEAVSWLADACAAQGDTANAKKWYEQSKKIVNNPAFSKEIDERIRQLNEGR